MVLRFLAAGLVLLLAVAGSAEAQQRERIAFESRQKGKPVQVTAEIYWPDGVTGPVPALVIHHGSGGISRNREGRFAREMVALGVAAMVIDSFGPRGVTQTVTDQSAVTGQDFNLDALAALKALGANSRIDGRRIGITGFSKGGTSSLMAAHERQVVAAGVPTGLRYALHVPFYPACVAQFYRPKTTGAPIYMLLGGADSYVGHEPCETYAAALRAEGARIEVKVFPGAGHGFDGGAPYFNNMGENYAQCVFQEAADGSWRERKSGIAVTAPGGKPIEGGQAAAIRSCRTLGVSGGANEAAAKQSMDDLKTYVRRHLQGG